MHSEQHNTKKKKDMVEILKHHVTSIHPMPCSQSHLHTYPTKALVHENKLERQNIGYLVMKTEYDFLTVTLLLVSTVTSLPTTMA